MFFRYKLIALIFFAVSIVAINRIPVDAAWWEEQNIPLPVNTEEVKTETRMMYGSQFNFTYYTSAQDIDSIKGFYRNRLPNLGWKEREIAKELGQVQGLKMDASFNNVLGQNLTFEKGSDMLIVNFMPAGFSKDGKTRFSISKGKIDLSKPPSPDTSFAPELLTKPKKDVAPIYPGASLTNLSEQASSLRATYFTKDDIEQVISFYKTMMPNYGWYLNSEKPIEKIDFGAAGEYDVSKYCPSCPKGATDLAKSMETWLAELNFNNQKGDICNIVLSNVATAQGMPGSLNMTTILVNYEEKK